MAKRGRPKTPTTPYMSGLYDVATIAKVCVYIKGNGFTPVSVLREEFGPEATTQAIALLYRDLRIFREVRRAWADGKDALGYEWADRRFSHSEAKQIHPDLGFLVEMCQSYRPKYGEFVPVTVPCRWINAVLGSVPVKDGDGDPVNCFERDEEGYILIFRYHQRAMASMALPEIGKEAAIARRIGFSLIRIPPTVKVREISHGIVSQPGRPGEGKGLRRSERIPDGTPFTIRALVPTTMLSVEEFLSMLHHAGQYVGLSPGRSAGFGDFEVLGAD